MINQTSWSAEEVGNTKEVLSGPEWARISEEALALHGSVCQCCGANEATGATIHVDHIKPHKLFPELALDFDNLQIMCDQCFIGRGNWDMTDWRKDPHSSAQVRPNVIQ